MAMIKVKRILAPANGAVFDDICSFTTETFIGIYDHTCEKWLLVDRESIEFSSIYIKNTDTLEELDDAVYMMPLKSTSKASAHLRPTVSP